MKVHRLRPVAAMLLYLHLVGCMTWRPVQVSPREFIEVEAPGSVRVQDVNGDWKTLTSPRIEGDSIVALETVQLERARRVSMLFYTALVDVTDMETRRLNGGLTVGVILLTPIALVALVITLAGGWDTEWD